MDELDKPIGTIEKPRLSAGSILVDRVEIVEKTSTKGRGGKFKIVNFICKHPDATETISIGNLLLMKVQGNNKTITRDGIWYREDSEGKIDKTCNAALIMKHYNKTSLKQFEGSTIVTELDSGYLTAKAY